MHSYVLSFNKKTFVEQTEIYFVGKNNLLKKSYIELKQLNFLLQESNT